MEIIKWANNEGYTIVLSRLEAQKLKKAISKAIYCGNGSVSTETGTVEIQVEST